MYYHFCVCVTILDFPQRMNHPSDVDRGIDIRALPLLLLPRLNPL